MDPRSHERGPDQGQGPPLPRRRRPQALSLFTADGYFGSRDANGEQVDDGQYRLSGNDTLVIGDVTFHYKITDGGRTISFTPEIPKCAPSCFEAGWSVSVAYPGYTWQRIS
jgi:hypothetical protein